MTFETHTVGRRRRADGDAPALASAPAHVSGPEFDVTVAIVTRNRRDELRRALASTVEQEGARIDLLVLDDGSTDGTAQMVAAEFPGARVARFDDDADVAVRRNDAARLAHAPVILSIDDDAVFPSTRTVADTLREFDHPRIAAVAIPYIDVGISDEVAQHAPDADGRWITTVFRATAYAIRRDVQLEVGGYSPVIRQFGEEWDLCLKLLRAGYVVRLGRADPIHHHTSVKRDYLRMDILSRRSELLVPWMYFPAPFHMLYPVAYSVRGLRNGVRAGRGVNQLIGLRKAVGTVVRARRARDPLTLRAFRLDREARARVRAGGALRLEEIEARLAPHGPQPKPQAGGLPRGVRALYGPARAARTRATALLGRPVRCEVCGEELFRVIPYPSKGRVKVLGAETERVRVDWDRMNRLSFRHVDVDRCRPLR